MDVTLILGSMAIVGAIGVFWWGLTARPSAARSNLMAGLPEPAPPTGPLVSIMRQLGQTTQRLLPNALVDGLGVKLVQAGHPRGLDLPRLARYQDHPGRDGGVRAPHQRAVAAGGRSPRPCCSSCPTTG